MSQYYKLLQVTYVAGRIIKSPTYVIKAESTNFTRVTEKNWSKMVKNKVKYYEIPGDHEFILVTPYAYKLAEVITGILSERQ